MGEEDLEEGPGIDGWKRILGDGGQISLEESYSGSQNSAAVSVNDRINGRGIINKNYLFMHCNHKHA